MKTLFNFINPFVIIFLKSPLHFFLSHQILLFKIIGRKSKKIYEIPASYAEIDGALVCVTLRENLWWKTFKKYQITRYLFQRQTHNKTNFY